MMATRALLFLGEASNKCIFSNVQFHKSRVHVQTSWKHARGFKRNREISKQSEPVVAPEFGVAVTPLKPSKLWKALGFTVAFGSTTMVAASIWEYERMRKYTHWVINQYHSITKHRLSRSGWRGEAEKWWNSLTEGQRVFAPICFLNVLVFLSWRIPGLRNTMIRYFSCNPASSAVCWPMLLSTFSHYSVFHLAANMYVLHSFSSIAVSSLGKEQFVAFYLTSGVVSSLASNCYKTVFSKPGISIGASGAIMGVVALICTHHPDTMLNIAFIPAIQFTAGSAIKALLAMDITGCVLGWRFMDHAAHLGGALFGIFWQAWGNSNIWQKREPLVKYWHKIRQPPQS